MHQFTVTFHLKPFTLGACVFSCKLAPTLLTEWPGSFMWDYSNTDLNRYWNMSTQKVDYGEDIFSAAPCRTWTPLGHESGTLPLNYPCYVVMWGLLSFTCLSWFGWPQPVVYFQFQEHRWWQLYFHELNSYCLFVCLSVQSILYASVVCVCVCACVCFSVVNLFTIQSVSDNEAKWCIWSTCAENKLGGGGQEQ